MHLILLLTILLSIVPFCEAFDDPCPDYARQEIEQAYLTAASSRDKNDFSCDAACERNYAIAERTACEYAEEGYCYHCDNPALSMCKKYGISISCGAGPTVIQPPPKSDDTWILVIGAIAVVGVVGGALVLTKKKPPAPTPVEKPLIKPIEVKTKGEEKKEEKKPSRYILQISTDRLSVEPGQPAHLVVSVWKQVGSPPPQRAPEAAISLTVPADSGLLIIPSSGQGELRAQVRGGDAVNSGEFPLTVTASAKGSTQEATVMISIKEDYVMRFE